MELLVRTYNFSMLKSAWKSSRKQWLHPKRTSIGFKYIKKSLTIELRYTKQHKSLSSGFIFLHKLHLASSTPRQWRTHLGRPKLKATRSWNIYCKLRCSHMSLICLVHLKSFGVPLTLKTETNSPYFLCPFLNLAWTHIKNRKIKWGEEECK